MDVENLRKALIMLEKQNLLNNFVNEVFGYSLKSDEYVYIQFKIVDNNIVMNIFDNVNNNRFKAFIFTHSSYSYTIFKDLDDNESGITYLNIETCYRKYLNNASDKLILFAALLQTKDKKEQSDIINKLFNKQIATVFKLFI